MANLKIHEYYTQIGGALGWLNNQITAVMNPANCAVGIDGHASEMNADQCDVIIGRSIQMFDYYVGVNQTYIGQDPTIDPNEMEDDTVVIYFDPKPDVQNPIAFAGWGTNWPANPAEFDDGRIHFYADSTYFDYLDVQARFLQIFNHEWGHILLSGHTGLPYSMMRFASRNSLLQGMMPTVTDLCEIAYANNHKEYGPDPLPIKTTPFYLIVPDTPNNYQQLWLPCVVNENGDHYTVVLERHDGDEIDINGETKSVFQHAATIPYLVLDANGDVDGNVEQFRLFNMSDFEFSDKLLLDGSGRLTWPTTYWYSMGEWDTPVTIVDLGDGRVYVE